MQPSPEREISPSSRNPRASVVIPTYNHGRYVADAIQSVLNQTSGSCEIIVVDDGSQDNTRQVVSQFGDRVRYIRQENRGLSGARNTGIRAARGEFIGLLDSDDLYEREFLNTFVSTLDAHPEAAAAYCIAQTVDASNKPLPQRIGAVVAPEQLYGTLLKGGFFPPSCMFVRKFCYEEPGYLFDESMRRVEDLDLWLKFAKRYTVIGIQRALVRYRIMPQSLSTDPDRVLSYRLALLGRHFRNGNSGVQQQAAVQQAYGQSYLATALDYLQVHDLGQTYLNLIRAFTAWPQLLSEFATFYELGLGDQPRGFRGDFSTLNLAHSADMLLGMLDKMFADSTIGDDIKCLRNIAYSNANLALGILSYGARRFHEARHFLFHAATDNPRLIYRSQFWTTVAKSFFPAASIDWLKDRRRRIS
jgi:glycosyltransferase involved in cell wall biosynthesis